MRTSFLFGLALSLVACRTSNLGTCAKDSDCTTGICDLNQHVCVLQGQSCSPPCDSSHVCDQATLTCQPIGSPPVITGITFTPPGVTDASGNRFIGPGSGPVSVEATITAAAGVAASSVCLRVSGETGACAHPGTAGASNTYTFNLPRPAPPQDGSTSLNFTLEADDTLAASLTGSAQAQHETRLAQSIFFDYQGPSISVTSDSTPYARTAVPIPVTALIADPAGVPDGGVFLNGTIAPATRDGGLFTFNLDPRGADAGVEGAYTFQVSAVDDLANPSDAGAFRLVDDAPPDASVGVFKGTDPGTTGVTYP
ncbi:MAG: hypothetical protein LC689_11825, partial [Myxococcales bacterium]|nr:hypothetical protein [Myxococcales bacterium]